MQQFATKHHPTKMLAQKIGWQCNGVRPGLGHCPIKTVGRVMRPKSPPHPKFAPRPPRGTWDPGAPPGFFGGEIYCAVAGAGRRRNTARSSTREANRPERPRRRTDQSSVASWTRRIGWPFLAIFCCLCRYLAVFLAARRACALTHLRWYFGPVEWVIFVIFGCFLACFAARQSLSGGPSSVALSTIRIGCFGRFWPFSFGARVEVVRLALHGPVGSGLTTDGSPPSRTHHREVITAGRLDPSPDACAAAVVGRPPAWWKGGGTILLSRVVRTIRRSIRPHDIRSYTARGRK